MKRSIYFILALSVVVFFTSCATIVGGSRYRANVYVEDHPNAKIYYEGAPQGSGNVDFLVKRSDANKFSVSVKEEGCAEQKFDFTQRKFRGWAFAGTVVTFTGLVPGTYIPLPWGIATDFATGALWKPDVNEPGVSQISTKEFRYIVDYKGCEKKVK
jgi:hypothetical protein